MKTPPNSTAFNALKEASNKAVKDRIEGIATLLGSAPTTISQSTAALADTLGSAGFPIITQDEGAYAARVKQQQYAINNKSTEASDTLAQQPKEMDAILTQRRKETASLLGSPATSSIDAAEALAKRFEAAAIRSASNNEGIFTQILESQREERSEDKGFSRS